MCAKEPSLKKNGSATERKIIYKTSHWGRKEVNDQVFFSLKMQNRRGDIHDMLVDLSPTRHQSLVEMWMQFLNYFNVSYYPKNWVMLSGLLQQASFFHFLPSACPRVCRAGADSAWSTSSLSGILLVGTIPTAASLHGGRRKDITHAFFGEAELQYLCQGPMMQYQIIK